MVNQGASFETFVVQGETKSDSLPRPRFSQLDAITVEVIAGASDGEESEEEDGDYNSTSSQMQHFEDGDDG